MKKFGTIMVVIICAGVFLSYMGYFDKPEDRVNDFLAAFNRQDMKEMISMVDNPEVDKIKATLNFAGAISNSVLGVDVSQLLLDFLPISEDLIGYKGARMYADIKSTNMDMFHTDAKVYAVVTTDSNNKRKDENLVFFLKKENRSWYITDIQKN